MQDDLAARRKRLLFRATHRGILEADLVLGRYVAEYVETWGPEELAWWERLMEEPDRAILAWIMGSEPTPAVFETAMMADLRHFTRAHATALRRAAPGGD